MKKIFTLMAMGLTLGLQAQTQPLDNPHFKSVFPIAADGTVISVTTGHAAPYIYDYNKDGVDDLLVGEFGEEDFDGKIEGISHEYVQGRCRIYINHGSNDSPVYKDFQYLSAQGTPMKVPVTCCISFVPRFVDMDDDGIDDVISGSYTGETYFWKGLGDNEFAESIVLKDKMNDTIRPVSSMTSEPVDWDEDGDFDILISSRMSGVFLVENTGTAARYEFAAPKELKMLPYIGRRVPTHMLPHDWDKDGLFDLVCGTEDGDLVWYRNEGRKGNPVFGTPELLWQNPDKPMESAHVTPLGGRVKVWVCDYDRDGREDLLAGDVSDIYVKTRELSPKEQLRKKKLELRLSECDAAFARNYPELYRRYCNKDYPVECPEYHAYIKASSKYDVRLARLIEGYCKDETHGNVWVFIRK